MTHSAAKTMLVRGVSSLTEMFKDNMPKHVKDALTELKDSMTLAGNFTANQSGLDMIKLALSKEHKKLADETSELLFWSRIMCQNGEVKKGKQPL